MANPTPLLDSLRQVDGLFFDEFTNRPQGRYVHFVLVRETESFPVFQTDGNLNTIRVRSGQNSIAEGTSKTIARLVLFKRKQTSPERLIGCELLRKHGYITDTMTTTGEETTCIYNPTSAAERRCGQCADCLLYGYAVGEAGAEKSKVYSDPAFSITPYDESHRSFRFNALSENGTMYDPGAERPRPSYGELDHVMPQVFFPSLITLRDPIYEGFLYVLGNILRCDRYGGGETRIGKVFNHLIAVYFADAEIFSNLRYTQIIYDWLKARQLYTEPLDRDAVIEAAAACCAELIAQEPVAIGRSLVSTEVQTLGNEMATIYQSHAQVSELLRTLHEKGARYHGHMGRGQGRRGRRAWNETTQSES
jgi:CRISPR-associated protein Csc2